MFEVLWRWKALIGILVFLLVAGFIYLTAEDRSQLTPVESVLRDGVAPIQGLLTDLGLRLEKTWTGLTKWDSIAKENTRLQEMVDRFREENNLLVQLQDENTQLREALVFAKTQEFNLLAAEVVGRSPSNWYSTIVLNRGSADGVKPKMPVYTSKGIVGQVKTVTSHTATVLLIVDPKSAVGAMVRRTREPVLLEGSTEQPGTCIVRPLVREPDLQRGDRIVTSGLSQIYPPGLQIGYVDEVVPGKYGLSSTGYVIPWANLDMLELVFIIQDVAFGGDQK